MKLIFPLIIYLLSLQVVHGQQFLEESKLRGIDHAYRDKVLTGGGGAFFDFDNDGDEDLYLTGGLDRDRLYENDGLGNFVLLPNGIGFDQTIQYNTMGVATGDIDNNGYRDIFICTWDYRNDLYGPNILFYNNGDGTFTDISESAGITHLAYSTSATFLDYNKDGLLDIHVVNHVLETSFLQDSTGLVYGFDHDCFENFLYLNSGDLTFKEVAKEVGVSSIGCGLAAVATDIDFDNDLDLYIANDFGEFVVANELYENQYPINEFRNISEESGANVGLYGMGIAAGDYDQDLDIDFYITNIGRNVLIENTDGQFQDVTMERGVENEKVLGEGLNTTGWGTAFLDVDNDTWLDLFVANGRIPSLSINATAMNDPNKLFRNNGDKTFTDISEEAGVADERYARGFISADIDMDGDLDLLTVTLENFEPDAHTKLYINQLDNQNNFIQFKLLGKQSNRDAYGAKLWLYAGEKIFLKEIYGGGASYASQSSSINHFGLGTISKVDSLKIDWPNGHRQLVLNPAINTRLIIEEDIALSTSTIENYLPLASLVISPNPFQSNLVVDLPEGMDYSSTAKISVSSITGEVVYKTIEPISDAQIRLTDIGLPNGIYFLHLQLGLQYFSKKIIRLK